MMNYLPPPAAAISNRNDSNAYMMMMMMQQPQSQQTPQQMQQLYSQRSSSPLSCSIESQSNNNNSNMNSLTFPMKLHSMLTDSELLGFDDVVCWMGKEAFKVIDPHRFSLEIMPRYFNQTKYKSFQRQLNIYNFQKVQYGPLKGGYTHPFLVKGLPELSDRIKREVTNNNTSGSSSNNDSLSGVASSAHHAAPSTSPHKRVISSDERCQSSSSPQEIHMLTWDTETEGAFGDMPTLSPQEDTFTSTVDEIAAFATSMAKGNSIDTTDVTFPSIDPTPLPYRVKSIEKPSMGLRRGSSTSAAAANAILENDDIAFFKTLFQQGNVSQEKEIMDTFFLNSEQLQKQASQQQQPLASMMQRQHTPAAALDVVTSAGAAPSSASSLPMLAATAVTEYNFPRKLYRLLDDCDKTPEYRSICSWLSDGKQFKIHNKKRFVEVILPNYFDQTQYASFRRQLNMYSFVRQSMSTYANPFFQRGHRELLDHVVRKPGGSNKKD
ncbi:HSF-type DNA-binding protein [Nitzschia inconspicua]|uniref:HSF-type DNA-binding protein n=1 Tax=Nitzschia inconspicua TaxID=303405 RepID=A0A9K3KFA4_9STRA|nr:HSF-type DNA-binding protein [Nitzschia inconspicua]